MVGNVEKTHDSVHFIEKIADAIHRGSGFNPLLGSGVSAASGIIMGIEFADYLAYSVRSAFADQPWDFRNDGWPPYPNREAYDEARDWVKKEFHAVCSRYDLTASVDKSTGLITVISRKLKADPSDYDNLNFPSVPAAIRSPDYQQRVPDVAILASMLNAKSARPPYVPAAPRGDQSPSSPAWIRELGIRALADWRWTLDFLSRIEQLPEPQGTVLGDPQQSVIDRFNTFITSDKQPNLAHKMLAHLARPMRLRTILTTNFDTLTEEAFTKAGQYLTKFFVSNVGALPDPFLVRSHASIIKMHGELIETRADMSLDMEPSDVDKKRFSSYFVDFDQSTAQLRSAPDHLFVVGFSANDLRIARMIQYLLDRTARFKPASRPHVFWLSVSDNDTRQVDRLFGKDYHDRVTVHQTSRPDLLLLELYQRLTLSLPGGGQTYEYNHHVPPSRPSSAPFVSDLASPAGTIFARDVPFVESQLRAPSTIPSDVYRARDALSRIIGHSLINRVHVGNSIDVTRLFSIWHRTSSAPDLNPDRDFQNLSLGQMEKFPSASASGATAPILIDTNCGAVEALSVYHESITVNPGKHCLWFELSDYTDASSLLRDILRSVAIRIGTFQREQVTLHPLMYDLDNRRSFDAAVNDLTVFLRDMSCVYRLSPKQWTIFLYGRDTAGTCVGWTDTFWSGDDWRSLDVLMSALATSGFQVVFAFPTTSRLTRELHKCKKLTWPANVPTSVPLADESAFNVFKSQLDTAQQQSGAPTAPYGLGSVEGYEGTALSAFSIMSGEVLRKCGDDLPFRRFFYAVSLFRQSRRPSALFYEAVQKCEHRFNLRGIDNDASRAQSAAEWVRWMEENRIFYRKAGGHAWMHRDLRIAIRGVLDRTPFTTGNVGRFHGQELSRIHFWIGDWYQKAFFATGFSVPIIESLHHRYQAAINAEHASPEIVESDTAILAHRFLLFRSSLLEVIKTLEMARPHLKLWFANPHGFAMFDGDEAKKCIDSLRTASTKVARQGSAESMEAERLVESIRGAIANTAASICQESDLGRVHWIDDTATTVERPATPDSLRSVANDAARDLLNGTYKDDWDSKWQGWLKAILSGMAFPSGIDTSKKEELVSVLVSLVEFDLPNLKTDLAAFPVTDIEVFDRRVYARSKGEAIRNIWELTRCGVLLEVLRAFELLAYARLRRAKFLVHWRTAVTVGETEASSMLQVRLAWLHLSMLCNLAIDWCKHLPSGVLDAESDLRTRFQSYYGVALSNLDRFYEAHRHLNEAAGIDSKCRSRDRELAFAKVTLRRAEIVLTEAHRISSVIAQMRRHLSGRSGHINFRQNLSEKWWISSRTAGNAKGESFNDWTATVKVCLHPAVQASLPVGSCDVADARDVVCDLMRLLAANLDDAWILMENGERALSGRSQSSLWWGRLALMRLRACSYQLAIVDDDLNRAGIRMRAYSHRRISPQFIWGVFERGYLNSGLCAYRRARMIRYCCASLRVFWKVGDGVRFVGEKARELKKRSEQLLAEVEGSGVDQLGMLTEICRSAYRE